MAEKLSFEEMGKRIEQLIEDIEASRDTFPREYEYADVVNHLKNAGYWIRSAESKS